MKICFGLGNADWTSSVPVCLRYDVAVLYLQQANYDLDLAVETYLGDEKWEKEHPMGGSPKGSRNRRFGRRKIGGGQ